MMIPVYNTFRRSGTQTPSRATTKHYIMHSDVRENKEHYLLDIDLPGFQKEDIKAQVKDGYLCVEAGKAKGKEEKDDNRKVIHKERFDGVYRRTFFIGTDFTQGDITASYKHGVLHLQIPKNPKEDPKKTGSIQIA